MGTARREVKPLERPAADGSRGVARAGVAGTAVPGRWLVAVGTAFLMVGSGLLLASPASAGTPAPERPTPGACGPTVPASGVSGSVSIEGGPVGPSVLDALPLQYSYAVAYVTLGPGNASVLASGCRTLEGNGSTDANGSFAFAPAVPPTSCVTAGGEQLCTDYTGPYGPVELSPVDPLPVGYQLSTEGNGTAGLALAFVYELARVSIAPVGPTLAVAAGASMTFRASAWAANGSVSDLAVTFAWSEAGTGWSLSDPSTNPSVNLTPDAAPGPASLTVSVGAEVDDVALAPVHATVNVTEVATVIESAGTNRTALDAGGSVLVQLTALGAGGYPYRAAVAPGLDLPPVNATCTAEVPDTGPVEVGCEAVVTYPATGTAQPTVTVTNGYSSAEWTLPEIVVDPPPELEVRPAVLAGYVDRPVAVTVVAANGSGTSPFERACFAAPPAATLCEASAGPSWEFSPVFSAPGNYTAVASAVDADGVNASVTVGLTIVAPLAVGPIVPSAPNVTAGTPVVLSANVTGGLLPLRYWWNDSRAAGPLSSGEVAGDGALEVTVAPNASGALLVGLTVADALGTVVASTVDLSVGPPPADRVVPVGGPPPEAATVGEPVALAWEAFDLSGAPDLAFAVPVVIDVDAPAGPPLAWVNASGLGPLASLGEGEYGAPASAWVDGALTVNLTLATATTATVGLAGADLPGPVAPRNVTAGPDLEHLRLFDPSAVRPGARENATLWRADDRFGNPVPGAALTVELEFGAVREGVVERTFALAGGGTAVWVNYSAPTGGNGTVTVVDGAGDVVLGPLEVPALSPPAPLSPAVDALAAAVPAGAIGLAGFAVVRRRRRRRAGEPAEEDLRQLAEGRARAVELIGSAGTLDLAGLEAAWGRPTPPAIADWVASLVADGTLRARVGGDGRARFCLARLPADLPRVTVDAAMLDLSLRRRDAAIEEPGAGDDRAPP